MKRYFIANWKMYLSVSKCEQLAKQLVRLEKQKKFPKDVEVIVAPQLLAIQSVALILKKAKSKIKLAAQDLGISDEGAFTGGISGGELKRLGVSYVIVGHSERREYFSEDGVVISKKAAVAKKAGLEIIYCVGETKDERHAARAQQVVKAQLKEIKQVPAIIAYEPRWAIGTGIAIEPCEAEQMHEFIAREAKGVPVCYGGSVSEKNIGAFAGLKETSGVLVGSASTTSAGCAKLLARMQKNNREIPVCCC